MVNNWTNKATWLAACRLSYYRYSKLMIASREIWGDAEASENRAAVAMARFAAFVQEVMAADKLAGDFAGVCFDDIDFVQIANHWLTASWLTTISGTQRMCGRFTQRSNSADVAKAFDLAELPELFARYNVAPTQDVPIVRLGEDERRHLSLVRWGLIPFWAKDAKIGSSMINARADTIAEKPAFKKSFVQRRCLVVADGFYEWQKTGTKKQPFYIKLKNDQPFAFAGLWERWKHGPTPIESCTIITTEPNELMSELHDRMPVILPPDAYGLWLDPAVQEPERLTPLLRPFPAGEMTAYPVSTLVNSPRNEQAECIERVA